jgi:putative DNA primase/helicase
LASLLIRSLYPLAKRIRDADERQAFLKHLVKIRVRGAQTALCSTWPRSDPSVAIRPGDLDRDPWLLTVKNGTLDLRTGQLRPARSTGSDFQAGAGRVRPHARSARTGWSSFTW